MQAGLTDFRELTVREITGFDGMSISTHWGRVTRICVGKLTIIGVDNGLLPGQHQAII